MSKRQGWCLCDVYGGRFNGKIRIQRIDDLDAIREVGIIGQDEKAHQFSSDENAIAFVRRHAKNGDVVCQKALQLHNTSTVPQN